MLSIGRPRIMVQFLRSRTSSFSRSQTGQMGDTRLFWCLNSTGKCNRLSSWHRKGQLVYFPWPFQTQLPTEALMGTYHPLTEHQRYQMYALKKAGHSQQSIAATVLVSPSTICRALRRNRGQRGYRPGQAHHKALARRRHKAKATQRTAAVIERIEADIWVSSGVPGTDTPHHGSAQSSAAKGLGISNAP